MAARTFSLDRAELFGPPNRNAGMWCHSDCETRSISFDGGAHRQNEKNLSDRVSKTRGADVFCLDTSLVNVVFLTGGCITIACQSIDRSTDAGRSAAKIVCRLR